MTPSGVEAPVIVRVGNEAPLLPLDGRFWHASTGDCPRRQPTPLTAPRRRLRTPTPSTPTRAAHRWQTEIQPHPKLPGDQMFLHSGDCAPPSGRVILSRETTLRRNHYGVQLRR